jgi:hypothetical protein
MRCFSYKEFDVDQFSPSLPFRVDLGGKWLVFEDAGDIWLHGHTLEPQEMYIDSAIHLIQIHLDNWKEREAITARIQMDIDNWWGKGEPASWFL